MTGKYFNTLISILRELLKHLGFKMCKNRQQDLQHFTIRFF